MRSILLSRASSLTSRHNDGVSTQTIEAPVRTAEPRAATTSREDDRPWIVIVWNDPVNLMTYVTFVFQKLFGYTEEKADGAHAPGARGGQGRRLRRARARRRSTTSRASTRTGSWATMQQD